MKAIIVLSFLLVMIVAGFGQAPAGYHMNPAAQKQAERQAYRDQQRREAEERAYRQLLIEYLDRIARQRR